MLDPYFSYVPFSDSEMSMKVSMYMRVNGASEPCWQGCWFAAVPPVRWRWDSTKLMVSVNDSDYVCECGWFVNFIYPPGFSTFPSWDMLVLRRVPYSYVSCFLDFEFHIVSLFPVSSMGPPWLAGHRSDSLAHVQKSCNNLSQIWRCRAFWPMIWRERGRLDGLEWEYLEMVGEIQSLEFFGIWVGYAVGSGTSGVYQWA